jgi:proline racemase
LAIDTSIVVDPAVIPQITGMAYRCGTSQFTLDLRDPFVAGFVLR